MSGTATVPASSPGRRFSVRTRISRILGCLLLGLLAGGSAAGVTLTLTPDKSSPQAPGTPILWTATYDGVGQFVYRFTLTPGEQFPIRHHVVRDYAADPTFLWAEVTPGSYDMSVTVRRVGSTSDTTVRTYPSYELRNDTTGPSGSVRLSEHPLVAIYCTPSCSDTTDEVALEVRRPSDPWQRRIVKPCLAPGSSTSHGVCFWVAGLRAGSTYLARHVELTNSGEQPAPHTRFTSGSVGTLNVGGCTPTLPWTGANRPREDLLLVSPPPESGTPVPFAVDMTGRLVWYDDGPDQNGEVALVTTINDDGTILELVSSGGIHDQILREIDPAGHAVRQTSVARINSQLESLGAPDSIGAFFHEAIRFPDGKTLVGSSVERMLEGVQGIPAGSPEDVLGNMILSLDDDWQVVWYWDAFEKLDVDRGAILNEHCGNQTPGCPPLALASVARDWTHGNCLVPAWETVDLMYSLRHQDWIAFINYDNGAGDGTVDGIIGKDGDLFLVSGDPTDWFSHQHGISPLSGGSQFLLFDNGNTRCDGATSECHSRAQLWEMGGGVITPVENTDLGDYSSARGMSQKLDAGDTHFTLGTLGSPSAPLSRSVELDASQNESFAMECSTWAYRTYRLKSLEAPR